MYHITYDKTKFAVHVLSICDGFKVMASNESPEVTFTLLRTRFRKVTLIFVVFYRTYYMQRYKWMKLHHNVILFHLVIF